MSNINIILILRIFQITLSIEWSVLASIFNFISFFKFINNFNYLFRNSIVTEVNLFNKRPIMREFL